MLHQIKAHLFYTDFPELIISITSVYHFWSRILTLRSEFFINCKALKTVGEAFISTWKVLEFYSYLPVWTLVSQISFAFQSKGSFARNTPSPSVRQTSTPPITWREAEVKLERTDVSCDDSEVDMVRIIRINHEKSVLMITFCIMRLAE